MSCTIVEGAAMPARRVALRCAVLAWDEARAGRRASGAELWPALLAGEWSVLDVFTAAEVRYIVARNNPDHAAPLHALVPRERRILELALAGRSGKWTAFELKLSESVVARALHTALHKIGVGDTATLAGVPTAAFEPSDGLGLAVELAIARTAPAAGSLANLSSAERAVVTRILVGKRITAIAHERGTSPRTVAHQLSSVYRKLGASSRRELLALLS